MKVEEPVCLWPLLRCAAVCGNRGGARRQVRTTGEACLFPGPLSSRQRSWSVRIRTEGIDPMDSSRPAPRQISRSADYGKKRPHWVYSAREMLPFLQGLGQLQRTGPWTGQDRAGPCRIVCRPSPPCAPPSGALSLLQPVPRQPWGHSPREDIICPGTRCGPWGAVVQGIGLCSSRWQVF